VLLQLTVLPGERRFKARARGHLLDATCRGKVASPLVSLPVAFTGASRRLLWAQERLNFTARMAVIFVTTFISIRGYDDHP